MQDGEGLAAGAGDRYGAAVGLEPFGIGEAGSVVADLGEHPGASERAESCEAGDDPGVWLCSVMLIRARRAGGWV